MIFQGCVLFFFGLFSFGLNRKHLISLLISLEMMMLGLFVGLLGFSSFLMMEVLIFFLVMIVCEASLGLSLLVVGVYFYGSDHLQGYSVLGC